MFRFMTSKVTTLTLLALAIPAWASADTAVYQHIDHKARFDSDAKLVISQTHRHPRPHAQGPLFTTVRTTLRQR